MSGEPQYTHCLPDGSLLMDYRIDSVLGKGGFGITYLAEDIRLKKKVAIKELLPDGIATRGLDSSVIALSSKQEDDFQWAVDSFLKEAQTLAEFEHPNIVRIYRLFEEHNTAYMVMPFIKGVSLREVVKQNKSLSYEEVNKIILQLLDGLEAVHDLDTLHRDIKPDNIIISQTGEPILIDFGAARQTITGRTQDITSIITPGYAPAEQYSTDARYQGPWSDIYALAAVGYFMITGKKPIPASERSDALRNMQPDPLPKLAEMAPAGYPQYYLQGLDIALQMSEQHRPQTVPEFRDLLSGDEDATQLAPPLLHDDEQTRILNAPITPKKKGKKTVFIAALCALMLALFIGGGFLAWQFISGNFNVNPDAKEKFTKIEAYLKVNEPFEARNLIETIDRESLSSLQKETFDSLLNKTDDQIQNSPNTLVVSIEPTFAKTELNGREISLGTGQTEIKGLGKHTLRVFADGYLPHSVNFTCDEANKEISLSKISLRPALSTRDLIQTASELETALSDEHFIHVRKLSKKLKHANPPNHMEEKVELLLEKSEKLLAEMKWHASLTTNPSYAILHLNGKRIYPIQSRFKVATAGEHSLEISASGFDTETISFTIDSDGTPLDLGNVTLLANKPLAGKQAAQIGMTQTEATKIATDFILAGNSPNQSGKRLQYLHESAFYGSDQDNQKPKEEIKELLDWYNTRWPTRQFTITGEATVKPHDTANAWVVRIPFSVNHNDGLFTLTAPREGIFAVMKLNGQSRIVAYQGLLPQDHQDKLVPNKEKIVAHLKKFNDARLAAGNSEGGKSIEMEILYYSQETEFYGPEVINRDQIKDHLKESRANSQLRFYKATSYDDFVHMTQSDPTGKTFTFKCVVEVTKDNGKTTRNEEVEVKYFDGKPLVTSVRY